MLETDLTYWIYASYVLMGVFILAGIAILAKGKLLYAAFAVGAGIALMTVVQDLDKDRYFDIALLNQTGNTIIGEVYNKEVGGIYTFPDSRTVIMRRGEGKRGSFILNNTDQYAVMISIHYGNGAMVPQDEILAVVSPGEYKYVPWMTTYVFSLDEEDTLPESIETEEGIAYVTRYWVTWMEYEPDLGPGIYE